MGTTSDPGATPPTLSADTRVVMSLSVKTVLSAIRTYVIKLGKARKVVKQMEFRKLISLLK